MTRASLAHMNTGTTDSIKVWSMQDVAHKLQDAVSAFWAFKHLHHVIVCNSRDSDSDTEGLSMDRAAS